jgi:hypothetical protein
MALTRDLASKLGRDLPDIADDEYSEDEDEDEEDRHSSSGITYGLFRLTYLELSLERLPSSASRETMKRHSEDDDSDSSDQALDLAALRRSRLQHPGTISMFEAADKEKGTSGIAEKVRDMFDLPAAEKFITGRHP